MHMCHTKTGFMHLDPSISDADVEQQLGHVAQERRASVAVLISFFFFFLVSFFPKLFLFVGG